MNCSVADCDKSAHARKLCPAHYQQWRKRVSIEVPGYQLPDASLWEQVFDTPEGCWMWTGRVVKGYGQWSGGRLAHRVAYEQMVATIPRGLELDHLCKTPLCVNPFHLDPVTRLVNMRRRFVDVTHCKHGHEFTPKNTIQRPGGHRGCRACDALTSAAYRRKRASA